MIRRFLILACAVAGPLAAQDSSSKGGVRLGLTYDGTTRPGIAVIPVRGDRGDSVRAILQRDLRYGDRVTIVGDNPDELPLVSGEPNFELFTKIGVTGIVVATVTPDGLNVKTYDATKKTMQLMGVPLPGAPLSAEWRMSVHKASDAIEQWATGVHGIAATRIAFVRGGKVWHVDSDGENMVPVPGTDGSGSPAWHPSGRYVAFSMLPDASSAGGIAIRDLVSGTTKRMTPASRSGSWQAPVFSPDGATLIYAYGLDRGTDLWALDWEHGGAPKRITGDGSDNTSVTFSPDGRQIAFTSGRLGNPEVYISDADGSNAQLLTTRVWGADVQHTNPAWSPDSRLIAYQSRSEGLFQVITVSPTGKNPTALTSEGQNEDPSWAPDSRHIVFTSRRTGNDQLWILDTMSGQARQLTHGPAPAKAAAWSAIFK